MCLVKGRTYYTKAWYNSYRCMMSRCYRQKDKSYKWYGGRGIRVCEEWHDIRNFEKWVEDHHYSEGMTLDRIDVDGDYCPDNCRWATRKEQANNRSNTVRVTWHGATHTLSEWADITGLNHRTVSTRYWRGARGDKLFREVSA